MRLFDFIRKHRKLSAIGAAILAAAIGISQLLQDKEKEVIKDETKQEIVLKKVKKKKKRLEKKEATPAEIIKANAEWRNVLSKIAELSLKEKKLKREIDRIKKDIEKLEAEPAFNEDHYANTRRVKEFTQKTEIRRKLLMKLLSLSAHDVDNWFQHFGPTVHKPGRVKVPQEIRGLFPEDVTDIEIINFATGINMHSDLKASTLRRHALQDTLRDNSEELRYAKKVRDRMNSYLGINNRILKIIESESDVEGLREYIDKMNRLNDQTLAHLEVLNSYIKSLEDLIAYIQSQL